MSKKKIALIAGLAVIAGLGVAVYASLQLPPSDATKLPEGATAPAFSLPASTGANVSLAELARGGSAVLVFYRGDW